MPTAAVATATSPLWFTTRATGLTALVLLTVTVVLGILTSLRFASPAWPRFVTVGLHRNLSLLTITFTALHVITTVTDPFASIGVVSVVVPFTSAYRTVWLGFGAVAFDLLLAVLVTSLLRTRIRPRVWRVVHWAGYACWPVALVHGLGTGTDGAARWVLAVTAACALAVTAAGVWRLATGWPARAALRVNVAAAAVLLAFVTAAWAWTGPLRPGWARRAGTPAALLARSAGGVASSGTSPGGAGAPALPALPFQEQVTGTVSFASGPGAGDRTVTLSLSSGSVLRLKITISGPEVTGGVEMTASQVTMGPPAAPARYTGQVTVLEGTAIRAVVAGAGQRIDLSVNVAQSGNSVTGIVTAAAPPAGGEGEGEGGEP